MFSHVEIINMTQQFLVDDFSAYKGFSPLQLDLLTDPDYPEVDHVGLLTGRVRGSWADVSVDLDQMLDDWGAQPLRQSALLLPRWLVDIAARFENWLSTPRRSKE